ncbi:MAG: DUF2911 domain-containing protein [Reichenbachiella sp.]
MLTAFAFSSNAQIDTPQPSPAGSVTAKVGLTDVEINYSRPQMKGRTIFGAGDGFLVPFDVMWRAGANRGTNVKFSTAVNFGGTDVEAGEYKLLAKPGASEWTIVLDKDLSIGGNVSDYDESQAVALAKVKSSKLTEAVSTLTFNVSDLSADGTMASIELAWENTSVKIPITVSFDEAVMKSIAKNTVVNAGNYRAAAAYYVSAGKDLDQAIEWFDAYLAEGDNSKHFWVLYQKAEAQAKNGDKKGAKKTAEQSIEYAKAWKDGDFGYIKRNEELIAGLK